ncbi:hypothetical protein CC86DRAFT_364887 [Ophiobolus disseminans]|uniref:Knr4/Smi1-like domain-containing protein n=1 Tax=Ophiobolus disseminans TaxID=1469910 RepID=A0A6A7AJV6_9PLEO|nr:hypothetical protein CC86DRAFT_364887 [Ophiobolus disseminans]
MSNRTKSDREDILSHPSLPVVYSKIRGLAKELAVLGKIDFASKITDLLLLQNHTKHGIGQMQFLNFAFEQTGDWPSVIPRSERSKEVLNELEVPPSGSIDEKRYNDLINQVKLCQRDPALCLTIAVVLCEQSGKADVEDIQQDKRVIKALEQVTDHFHDYIASLIQHRKIWPLLASGVVARQLGVDDAKLFAAAEDIVETVRIRIENGRQKGDHEGRPIKELLEILVKNTKKHAGSLYKESQKDPPKSYLHNPATEQDINDMEQRLKIPPLPADYKEFLLVSNGLEPVYNGLGMTAPLSNTQNVVLSSLPGPVAVPLQLVQDSSGTAQLIREAGYNEWPSATKHIEIGRTYEPAYLLTDPSDVKATIKAYKNALASDEVSDVMKAETTRAIEDLYGSMEAFEKLEWAMMFTVDFDPGWPVGTLRSWLEETVRMSGKPYERSSGNTCLAYACRAG